MHSQSFLSAIAVLGITATAGAQTIGTQGRLNPLGFNPNGNNTIQGISIDEDPTSGALVAVWAEQNGTSEFTQDIYTSRSTDNGAHWSAMERIDLGDGANEFDSDFAKIAFGSSSTAIVIWYDNRDNIPLQSSSRDLFYQRTTDGGQTWLPMALPLNSATAGAHIDTNVQRASIDADGDRFVVTWEEDVTPGGEEIWFTTSGDAGLTWSAPLLLTSVGSDVDDPKVAVSGDVVHVAYIDDINGNDQVFYLRSDDGGATFAAPLMVETDATGNPDETVIKVDGDLVAITFTDNESAFPGGESAHVVVSADGGLTWQPEVNLDPLTDALAGSDGDGSSIAVRGDRVYVTFVHDYAQGNSFNEVFVSHTNDRGASWTLAQPVEAGIVSQNPQVLLSQDEAIIWHQHNPFGSNRPAWSLSTDGGATWNALGEIPGSGPDVDEPQSYGEGGQFALYSDVLGTAHVVYFDRPTGQNECYFARLDFGNTLGTNYCVAAMNSTGAGAGLTAVGSLSLAANNLTLSAEPVPNQPGIFFFGPDQLLAPFGDGFRCVGGFIVRISPPAIGSNGIASRLVDLPTFGIAPGAQNFQYWYRDPAAAGAGFNLSNGLEIVFQP